MKHGPVVLAVALGAGCGGEATVAAGPPTSALRVGLQEYEVAMSAGALQPGRVTVTVTNAGSAAHDLRLRQGSALLGATRVLAPGGQQELTVEVADGVPVRLDCTLAGHAEAGMVAELDVAAG